MKKLTISLLNRLAGMKDQTISAVSAVMVGGICIYALMDPSPATLAKRAAEYDAERKKIALEDAKQQAKIDKMRKDMEASLESEKRQKRWREEGNKALEEWDAAIRNNTDDRRKRLASIAVGHTMTNKHGMRIDRYELRNGQTVVCTTTAGGPGAAIFDCDGEP